MSLPLFISRRMYGSKGSGEGRPAILIATAGVAVGLFVMVMTVSVVMGFKHTIRDKVAGFGSHIQITNFLQLQQTDPISISLGDSILDIMRDIEGVGSVGRYVSTQGVLKTDSDFMGITFKGIGPDYDIRFLSSSITQGKMASWSDTKASDSIMLSETTANKLGLSIGDKVRAYFISRSGQVRARRFVVAALFKTNMNLFDENVCVTDLYTARRLNGWKGDQCSGAEVRLNDFESLNKVAREFFIKVNKTRDSENNLLLARTIDEVFPSVFGWLSLLDINVWVILALMTCLSAVTIISGLLIIILERTNMIGLLKALGAGNPLLRRTFLWFAAMIIGRGMVIGDLAALLVIAVQNLTGIISLDAETYYVSSVPMELNIPLIILLNLATLAICIAALLIPTRIISGISPARSMRYE